MSLIVQSLPDGGCVVICNQQPSKSASAVKPSIKPTKPLFGDGKVVKKKKFVFREPDPPTPKRSRPIFSVNHDTKKIKVRLPHATGKVLVFKPHVAKCPMMKMEDLIKEKGTISLWDEDSNGKLVEIRLDRDWKPTTNRNAAGIKPVEERKLDIKNKNALKTVEAEEGKQSEKREKHRHSKKPKLSPCELLRAPKSQKWQSVETPKKQKETEKPKVCPRKLDLEKIPEDDEPCSDFLMTTDDDFEICLFETGTVDDLLIGLKDSDFGTSPVQPVRVRNFRDAIPAKRNEPVLSSNQRKFQKFIQGRSTR